LIGEGIGGQEVDANVYVRRLMTECRSGENDKIFDVLIVRVLFCICEAHGVSGSIQLPQ
jgi:hypothetical protein